MVSDMAARGMVALDVAKAQGMAPSTVTRFLNGELQTPKTAKKIANTLGYTTPRRYLIVEAA